MERNGWQHSKEFESSTFSIISFSLSPVRFHLLVLQVSVSLLQLVRQNLQIPGQLVLGFEFLRQQHQVTGSVMQWNVADEQALPEREKEEGSVLWVRGKEVHLSTARCYFVVLPGGGWCAILWKKRGRRICTLVWVYFRFIPTAWRDMGRPGWMEIPFIVECMTGLFISSFC